MTFASMVALLVSVLGAGAPASASDPGESFVTRQGSNLLLNGKTFRFAGSNNYYLMYKSRLMVDDVFARAAAAKFTVLRVWGSLDIGNADGSNSVGSGPADGVYLHFWDGTAPAFNDGPNGLARLDYMLWKARQAGIKLIFPLVNNWQDFGGMDQYVRWRGGSFHDDFYTDPQIRIWYKDWINHLLNRTNTLTGIKYKDDPTVMTWELGNEPRCKGSGGYPTSASCTTSTLVSWADDVTRYIKSVDPKHLVSVGDEGFYCNDPASTDWTMNCGEGVDTVAFAALPAVDVMSLHLYPDYWGKDLAWTRTWIESHIVAAHRIGKAVMLGEFGWLNKATRNPVYQSWTDLVQHGGNGFLYWMLAGIQDDGSLYPDFDGFTVYCPGPVCQTITNAGLEISGGQRSLPPVADNDTATTPFDTPVTLTPAANDIAYRTHVRPLSIDLDPATTGQQTSVTVAGGQFTLDSHAVVTYTPAPGFSGNATASYTIRDEAGRTSNVANLVVTVKPDPNAAIVVASWESGVDGWAPGSWQANAGTLSQTAGFHTNGSSGLHVDAADGGWFGTTFNTPLNLAGKAFLHFDLRTGPSGTSTNVALQLGPNWDWCEGTWGFVNGGQQATVEVDFQHGFGCDASRLNEVHTIYVWFSSGTFDLDYVRAE
jgi:mannan endo-1,4-beta-mannosidase